MADHQTTQLALRQHLNTALDALKNSLTSRGVSERSASLLSYPLAVLILLFIPKLLLALALSCTVLLICVFAIAGTLLFASLISCTVLVGTLLCIAMALTTAFLVALGLTISVFMFLAAAIAVCAVTYFTYRLVASSSGTSFTTLRRCFEGFHSKATNIVENRSTNIDRESPDLRDKSMS